MVPVSPTTIICWVASTTPTATRGTLEPAGLPATARSPGGLITRAGDGLALASGRTAPGASGAVAAAAVTTAAALAASRASGRAPPARFLPHRACGQLPGKISWLRVRVLQAEDLGDPGVGRHGHGRGRKIAALCPSGGPSAAAISAGWNHARGSGWSAASARRRPPSGRRGSSLAARGPAGPAPEERRVGQADGCRRRAGQGRQGLSRDSHLPAHRLGQRSFGAARQRSSLAAPPGNPRAGFRPRRGCGAGRAGCAPATRCRPAAPTSSPRPATSSCRRRRNGAVPPAAWSRVDAGAGNEPFGRQQRAGVG